MIKRGSQFWPQNMPEKAWGDSTWAREPRGSGRLLLTPTASDLTPDPGAGLWDVVPAPYCRGRPREVLPGRSRSLCLEPRGEGLREGGFLSEWWCRGAGMSLSCACWEAPVDTSRPSKETGLLGGSGHLFEASWVCGSDSEEKGRPRPGSKGPTAWFGRGCAAGWDTDRVTLGWLSCHCEKSIRHIPVQGHSADT